MQLWNQRCFQFVTVYYYVIIRVPVINKKAFQEFRNGIIMLNLQC